ncbi:MAG TPA: 50S ribosomal protein L22 [Candidatus Thermoplasmatota archaeon]|nr:50S ribosomal protein L22 [Candidatus Thermoplasmatota archaeon]
MAYGYAAQNVDPETTAKAAGREIPVKPKFAVNVAKALKGKSVKQARTFLEEVIALKTPVPFRVHKRQVKHRRGKVGPGQYPVSVAAAYLRVLNDAASNAEYKGLDPDNMYVWHAAAHRAAPLPGFMPRAQGRATQWNKQCSHLELVLKNKEE